MKTDLPERTFAFAKRIVKLCQTLEEERGVAQTLSRQLFGPARPLVRMLKKGKQAKAGKISGLSTTLRAKKHARRCIGFGCLQKPKSSRGSDFGL